RRRHVGERVDERTGGRTKDRINGGGERPLIHEALQFPPVWNPPVLWACIACGPFGVDVIQPVPECVLGPLARPRGRDFSHHCPSIGPGHPPPCPSGGSFPNRGYKRRDTPPGLVRLSTGLSPRGCSPRASVSPRICSSTLLPRGSRRGEPLPHPSAWALPYAA